MSKLNCVELFTLFNLSFNIRLMVYSVNLRYNMLSSLNVKTAFPVIYLIIEQFHQIL